MLSSRRGTFALFAVSLLDILPVVAQPSTLRATECDGLPIRNTSFVDPAAAITFAVLSFKPKTRCQRLMREAKGAALWRRHQGTTFLGTYSPWNASRSCPGTRLERPILCAGSNNSSRPSAWV